MKMFTKRKRVSLLKVFALLLFSMAASYAQTTIKLPAACATCSSTNGSTNGSSVVSNYGNATCTNPSSGTINGTLTQGVAASGVTMSLYANVTTLGSWSITTVANNGITFSGSGTFTSLGCQPITLTASGTPNQSGTITVSTNTSPVGTASMTVASSNTPSSNGTAIVASYGGAGCTGNGILNGTYTVGQAMTSGNTLTFYANVTQVGTWNISTAANNGVTFSGSGTFTSTGCQAITLTASGTPTSAGSIIATTNTSPSGSASGTVSASSTPSSNGTAIVSNYGNASCTNPSAGTINGTLTQGVAASGVTMTLYANVTQIGSWNITTIASNGITFSGSGTFTTTGCQAITLTASGTPTSTGSVTANTNTTPVGTATATVVSPTTNGTSEVASYGNASCANPSAGTINGTLTQGVAASGVTMTLYANVTKIGSWSITTTASNGVTFSGSGTFTTTGCQPITLTASGTPTSTGSVLANTNTTPVGTATATVVSPTTNGVAEVANYGNSSCANPSAGTINGTLTQGVAVSGVTMTLYANVTKIGSWSITTTANNGVTFSGSGTFTTTGCQAITLTASGTPTSTGSVTANTNTTPVGTATATVVSPISSTSNGTGVVSAYNCSAGSSGTLTVGTAASGVTQTITATVTTAGTYNISTTANGVTFAASGTFAGTGNQNITLTATGTPTASGTNTFTLNTNPNCSFTRSVNNSPTSNGSGVVSAFNCNAGSMGNMTVGTDASGNAQSITATVTTAGTYNISASSNGVTFAGSGTFAGTGNQNITLTATGTPTVAGTNTFTINTNPNCSFSRTVDSGISASTNGTGVVSAYNCSGSNGTYGFMYAGSAVSGVTSNIIATVTTIGTYNISTTANGVTFSASGTFTGTGNQVITLTASGTPTAAGSNSFTLNTSPNCSFTRTTLPPSLSLTMGALSWGSGCNSAQNTGYGRVYTNYATLGGNFTLPAGTYSLSFNFNLNAFGTVYTSNGGTYSLHGGIDFRIVDVNTGAVYFDIVEGNYRRTALSCTAKGTGSYSGTAAISFPTNYAPATPNTATLPAGTYRVELRGESWFANCAQTAGQESWNACYPNLQSGGTITFTGQ